MKSPFNVINLQCTHMIVYTTAFCFSTSGKLLYIKFYPSYVLQYTIAMELLPTEQYFCSNSGWSTVHHHYR